MESELALILCCKCGIQMQSNSANMCLTCLSTSTDLAAHIDRQNTITFCPKCERYLNPPSQWVVAQPESPELLSLCIKRIRGLKKGLNIRNASFLWTEPHSRKIDIEIVVHGELETGQIVEQKIVINFTVHCQQCSTCNRNAAKDFWNACVQLRQKVEHKRTLLHLEQVILRAGMHKTCSNIKQVSGGIDFFFGSRSQAVSFVNFLCKRAPCRYQTAQHLKSHDVHNNTYNYKYTFSVEVAPICKNDVVCLSRAQSQKLSGIGPICVVIKVAEAIHLIDPTTCQICQVEAKSYFASPFTSIATQKQLSKFIFLYAEDERGDRTNSKKSSTTSSHTSYHPVGARISNHHKAISAWIMRLTSDKSGFGDDGSNDGMIHTRSHLGHILHPGDEVLGLDLRNINVNHTEFEKLSEHQIPDVILVLRPIQTQSNDGPSKRKRSRKQLVEDDLNSENFTSNQNETDLSEIELSDDNEDEYWSADDEFVELSEINDLNEGMNPIINNNNNMMIDSEMKM